MIENIFSFNTSVLTDCIQNHHMQYDIPITAEYAENVLVNFFEKNGQDVRWKCGSHKPGNDIFVHRNDDIFGFSVKSGKTSPKGKYLPISSYRTGKYGTLPEKINGIREIEKDITAYISFSRTEKSVNEHTNVVYSVYLIYPSVLSIESFAIKQGENNNFKGSNSLGITLEIRDKMSSQVWYFIPMDIVNDNKFVRKIYESSKYRMMKRV